MKIEVLLTGSFGVGKSSIYNRFIHDDFSHKYNGSMGVRISEKHINIKDSMLNIKLWDIAGEVNQDKVPKPYFVDKNVILYVIDISRPFTFGNIPTDINFLKKVAPNSQLKIIANKKDLFTDDQIIELANSKQPIDFDWFISAKTGEKIDALFNSIGEEQFILQGN